MARADKLLDKESKIHFARILCLLLSTSHVNINVGISSTNFFDDTKHEEHLLNFFFRTKL
jgi:hypothetical protein